MPQPLTKMPVVSKGRVRPCRGYVGDRNINCRVAITFDADVFAALQVAAYTEDTSFSEQVRRALRRSVHP